jgi:hypothetical protein
MIDSGTVEPAEGRGHGRVTDGPGPEHLCRERSHQIAKVEA